MNKHKLHMLPQVLILLATSIFFNLPVYANECIKDSCQTSLEEFEATIHKHREEFEASMLKHRKQFEADISKYTEAYMCACAGPKIIEEIKEEIIKKEEVKAGPDPKLDISKKTLELVESMSMTFINDYQKYNTDEVKFAYAAAETNDIPAMKYAIKSGYDINRCIPLLEGSVTKIAAKNGNTKMVEFLLNNGFDIKNHPDELIIYHATVKGHLEIVKILADAGAKLTIYDPEEHHHIISIGDLARQYNHLAIAEWYDEFTKIKKLSEEAIEEL